MADDNVDEDSVPHYDDSTLIEVLKYKFDLYYKLTSNSCRSVPTSCPQCHPQRKTFTYPERVVVSDLTILLDLLTILTSKKNNVYHFKDTLNQLAQKLSQSENFCKQLRFRVVRNSTLEDDWKCFNDCSEADQANFLYTIRCAIQHASYKYVNTTPKQYLNEVRALLSNAEEEALKLVVENEADQEDNYRIFLISSPPSGRRVSIISVRMGELWYHLYVAFNKLLNNTQRDIFDNIA